MRPPAQEVPSSALSEPPDLTELLQRGYEALGTGDADTAAACFERVLADVASSPVRTPGIVVAEVEALGGLRLATRFDDRVDQRPFACRELTCWREAMGVVDLADIGEGCARAVTTIGNQALVDDDPELLAQAVALLDDLLANAEPPGELDDEFAGSAAAYVDAQSLMSDAAWEAGDRERSASVLASVVRLVDQWGGYPHLDGWNRSHLRQAILVSKLVRRSIVIEGDRDEVLRQCHDLVDLLRSAFPVAMEQGDEDSAVAVVRLLPAAADHARAVGGYVLIDDISGCLEAWTDALAAAGGVAGQVLAGDPDQLRAEVRQG